MIGRRIIRRVVNHHNVHRTREVEHPANGLPNHRLFIARWYQYDYTVSANIDPRAHLRPSSADPPQIHVVNRNRNEHSRKNVYIHPISVNERLNTGQFESCCYVHI